MVRSDMKNINQGGKIKSNAGTSEFSALHWKGKVTGKIINQT